MDTPKVKFVVTSYDGWTIKGEERADDGLPTILKEFTDSASYQNYLNYMYQRKVIDFSHDGSLITNFATEPEPITSPELVKSEAELALVPTRVIWKRNGFSEVLNKDAVPLTQYEGTHERTIEKLKEDNYDYQKLLWTGKPQT